MPTWYVAYDNGYTTLDGELAQGSTSVTVAAAADLHGGSPTFPYLATIWNFGTYWNPGDDSGFETVVVTNAVGNTLTVTRGALGTDCVHASGSRIAVLHTSLHHKQLTDTIDTHDHSGGDGAAIPLAGMADMATASLLGRKTAGTGAPEVLSAADAKTLLGNVYIGTTAVALDRASAGLTLAGLTLTTPNLGTPSAGTLTNCTGLPIASGVSGLAAGVATFLAKPTSANLAAAVTDETGSGALVFATSPTLVTPTLGVATATSINAGSPATPGANYIYARAIGAYVSGGYGQLKVASWNDTAGYASAFTMFRARGTYASPSYCNSGDSIAMWYFQSPDTGGIDRAGATIQVLVDGDPGATYVPMGFNFLTYASASDYATRFAISASGNIVCGKQAALATNATAGFLYIPTCAGTPSGTPTSYTGKVALVYDSTNNKLYIYDGGWIQVALAA